MDQIGTQNLLRDFAQALAHQAKACRQAQQALDDAMSLLESVSDEQIIDAAHPPRGESILTIVREAVAASREMADSFRKIGQQVAALHTRAAAAQID